MAMERAYDRAATYEIRVRGALDARSARWFSGWEAVALPGGETLLTGLVADQAALYGLLSRIRGLGWVLLSLRCVARTPGVDQG